MYTVWSVGYRSTTWSNLVVLLVFCSVLQQATAQLHLFISKEDAETYLSEYFSFKKGSKFVNSSQNHVELRRRLNRDGLFYFRDELPRKVVPYSSWNANDHGAESKCILSFYVTDRSIDLNNTAKLVFFPAGECDVTARMRATPLARCFDSRSGRTKSTPRVSVNDLTTLCHCLVMVFIYFTRYAFVEL